MEGSDTFFLIAIYLLIHKNLMDRGVLNHVDYKKKD